VSRELTRRDALAALSAAGVAVAGCASPPGEGDGEADDASLSEDEASLTEGERETLFAAAEVLYPSAVTGIEEFLGRYVEGRVRDRPEHARGIGTAVEYLDEYCRAWYDSDFAALSPADRDEALRRMGVEDAAPDPDGSDVERLRYYVINDLLLALYASPTGGRLLGIENPPGHPGGQASYRRGPEK